MPYDVGLLYRDGNPLVYDGGDFRATLDAALEAAGYDGVRREQGLLRQRGVYRGVGISSYVDTIHMASHSPRNPLGVKGVGEGGAISPPAAIANAVEDALRPFGVKITTAPVAPSLIRSLLSASAGYHGPRR